MSRLIKMRSRPRQRSTRLCRVTSRFDFGATNPFWLDPLSPEVLAQASKAVAPARDTGHLARMSTRPQHQSVRSSAPSVRLTVRPARSDFGNARSELREHPLERAAPPSLCVTDTPACPISRTLLPASRVHTIAKPASRWPGTPQKLKHGEHGVDTKGTEASVCSPTSLPQTMFLFNCTPTEFVQLETEWCAVDQKASGAIQNVLSVLRVFFVSFVFQLLP